MCVIEATALTTAAVGSEAFIAAETAALMMNASLAGTALSTGMQVYGQVQQSKAAQNQANYQAQVSANNKVIADRRASDAEKRGEIEERKHRLKVEQLKGRQRSALSASGFAIDEGDAIGILEDTAEMGEFDALTIRHNSEVEAYNHRVEGMNHQAQSGLYKGQANAQSPLMAGGSALFSGASSVADKWYRYKRGYKA